MFKNKLKKVAGAVAVAGALLVSGLPASAAPDLTPIRDKYPDAYQFQWNGNNTVTVFFRDSQGKSYHRTYTCVTVIQGTCYVYK
ncbi:hypothetical protein [Bacillus haynesii]|uniref:LacI family transcriptional regulator n=2 Tax=Bacillus haynesii TaxID=1925021 RepID=A0AA90E9Y4_9BACI|nr:hypothetical protein [Bacillus haynesii]EWH19895.1 LacI family transcriptional regulator [Bacillus haynesii]MCI4126233.1 LacI family transcriptional regulator [Bacillus haynesii]MCY7769651.1 LacI family transcriptional regulator [Bacillus haynesii]MCY7793268.1 LacI family transcriptional regulator [Bacillus haynesii]MCY7850220.1 LacI family transcriptional regulator [Bacillus haynesii]